MTFFSAFLESHTVPQSSIDYFSSIPWTASFVNDADYEPFPIYSRHLKPSGEDYFFAVTVNTPSTLFEGLSLRLRNLETPPAIPVGSPYNRTTTPSDPYASPVPFKPDLILFVAISSPGLDGHPHVLHGGVAAAILDEAVGGCVMLHQLQGSNPTMSVYTARMDTVYRKPVPTPNDFMVRTWVTRRQGRKWWARGQMVDKNGVVLTEVEGLWVEAGKRPQNL